MPSGEISEMPVFVTLCLCLTDSSRQAASVYITLQGIRDKTN